MATTTKQFPFTSTGEGFTHTAGSNDGSGGWQSTDGNSGGCFYSQVDGRNKTSDNYIEWSGTWEDLGVPAGNTVNEIDAAQFDWRISSANVIDSPTIGALEIRNSAGDTVIATLVSSVAGGTSTTSFVTRSNSTPQSIGSSYQASDTSVKIRLWALLDNANDANAQTTVLFDNVELTIDYSAASVDIVPADSEHSHEADNVTITQTHEIVVNDSIHAHEADNVTIEIVVNIVPADSIHSHDADNVDITQTHVITVNDSFHSHQADNVSITQTHEIVAADAWHNHVSDNVDISQVVDIVPYDSFHTHGADNVYVSVAAVGLLVNQSGYMVVTSSGNPVKTKV